jgi:hypothetical protein
MTAKQDSKLISKLDIAKFLFRTGLGLFGVIFLIHQFSFSNFAKVEIDAYKLRYEIEQSRGVAYQNFSDMECKIGGFVPENTSKVDRTGDTIANEQTNTQAKSAKFDKDNAKENKALPNDYAKCMLAHKMESITSSVLNLSGVLSSLVLLLLLACFFGSLLMYSQHVIEMKKANKE